MGRLQSVQTLRFIAAFGVVLTHTRVDAFHIGGAGVDLFFVISGFIITRIGTGKSPGAFLAHRLRRIYPVYWLCSLPWVVLAAFGGLMAPDRAVASLTLWPVFGEYLIPYLKSGWTLSFEMLFYVCFAVTLWRPALAKWILAAYALAFGLGLVLHVPVLKFVGSPIILEFLAGVVIARAPLRFGGLALGLGIAGMVLATPLGARLDTIARDLDGWRALYAGLPAALILYGALQFEHRVKNWRVLPYLGDASYSLYLTNLLVVEFAPNTFWAQAPLAVLVGVVTYRYVEQPLLRWMRKPRPGWASRPRLGTP